MTVYTDKLDSHAMINPYTNAAGPPLRKVSGFLTDVNATAYFSNASLKRLHTTSEGASGIVFAQYLREESFPGDKNGASETEQWHKSKSALSSQSGR